MRKQFIRLGVIIVALVFITASCHKKQQLTITKDYLTFNASGGMDIFQIVANCDWTMEPSADWFYIGQTFRSNDTTTVPVFARQNTAAEDRYGSLTITSANGNVTKLVQLTQSKPVYSSITGKMWFTRLHERWNTDYYSDSIPDSYRFWTYSPEPGSENWFWYFVENDTSYQVHTVNYDTVYYPFLYQCSPELDILNISFVNIDSTLETYHATITQLNNSYLIFTNEYRPHHFEKNTLVNVSANSKRGLNVNPKKVRSKPSGPMITVN